MMEREGSVLEVGEEASLCSRLDRRNGALGQRVRGACLVGSCQPNHACVHHQRKAVTRTQLSCCSHTQYVWHVSPSLRH